DYDLKGWGDALILSADLRGWFTPTVFHPLFGGDIVRELHLVQQRALNPDLPGFRDLNTVFLGWVSLGLAIVGAVAYRRKLEAWIWTTVLFGLFTLGPLLQINGRTQFDMDGITTTVPLPFALLHYLPVIKANRAPNRNSVVLMLGLAVLAGYGVLWLLGRLERWQEARARKQGALASESGHRGHAFWPLFVIAGVCVGLILFEHLALPYPLSDARIPPVYDQIAADPAPGSVLQLPLGWRNSFGVFGPEQTLLQYYQTAYGRPMLGGNISRAPDFKMDYFKRIPYFQALTETEFGRPITPELRDAAAAQADELAYLYDTEFVVLTPPIADRLPYSDTWQASWDFVKSTWPLEEQPFYAQDGIEAYRVRQPEGSDSFRIDLGQAGTFPYRGEGWDAAETDSPYDTSATWATALQSRLFVPLRQVDPAATYDVRVQVHPFAYPGSNQQTVALAVNGAQVGAAQGLSDGWQEVTFQVPGTALVDGLNRIDLLWGYAAAPRTVTPGSRQIGSTGVELPIDADVKAFADGGFIALFNEAGEQSDASAGRRGVNVTVLDPKSGKVLDKAGFDTTANEGESANLAAYLQQIPGGSPVLVASYGDAWAHLTQDVVTALQGIGADVSLDGLQNQYFAIVGAAGAQPGSAVQTVDPADAFARVSLNRDRRDLAGAVDWVEIERVSG
ncbi:MAG: interleukin-like EMT inducer domain-containing protein, partial [Caldilineaceae bacterium]